MPIEQSLKRIPRWLTLLRAALKLICTIMASCQLSNALKCENTHRSSADTFPIDQHGWLDRWKHTSGFHKPTKSNPHQMLRQLWQYRSYMDIGRQLATADEDGIIVTSVYLQQAVKLPKRSSRRNTNITPRKHTKSGTCLHRGRSPTRVAKPHSIRMHFFALL